MMNMLSNLNLRSMVQADHGQPMTSSYAVAEAFNKRHADVLRAIKNMRCSASFRERNFALCFENNKLQNGKPQRFYQMTERGFMFLVMGFTGVKADAIKEAFIDAFEWMAKQLLETGQAKWQRLNYLILKRDFKKALASDNGRGLVAWRYEKTPLENEINQLTVALQPCLNLESP